MRRLILAVLAALALVLGLAGPASPYTLDTKIKTARDVAAMWNATGYVHIDVGRCSTSDSTCIKAAWSDNSCGTAGCATWGLPYCEVDLTLTVKRYHKPNLTFNVLAHETGHCVLHSSWHATDPFDIMYFSVSPGEPRRVIGPQTLAQLAASYP